MKGQNTNNNFSGSDDTQNNKAVEKVDIKTLWEIEDVKHGVIKLTDNRYRMIIRLATADFFLLSEQEQEQVEGALISTLMGLSFPVQFLVTSEAVNTRQAVQDAKEKLYKLNSNIQNYAQEYTAYMEGLMSERSIATRSAYCIIPFETEKKLEYARTELLARTSSVSDGLQTAKIQSELLDTAALVDLLGHLLNRGRTWQPSDADKNGVMNLYHLG